MHAYALRSFFFTRARNSSCSRKMKATTVNTDVSSSSDSGNCNSNNTLLPILTQKNRKTSSRKLSYRMDSEVADAFRLFDRDKDGRVTRSEIVDLIVSLDGDPECPHLQVPLLTLETTGLNTDSQSGERFASLQETFLAQRQSRSDYTVVCVLYTYFASRYHFRDTIG